MVELYLDTLRSLCWVGMTGVRLYLDTLRSLQSVGMTEVGCSVDILWYGMTVKWTVV